MKKFLVMLLTLMMGIGCIGFTGCGGSEGKTLNVYTNAGFAPYEYINEKGEVVGVDIDIMKEVGEVLGYKVVIKDIDFGQIMVKVAEDEFAIGAAGMTKRGDRDKVALPTISYATSVQYVIVPAGTFTESDLVDGKLPIAKLGDLTKKNIGVQESTTGNFLVEDEISGWEEEDEDTGESIHVTGALEGKGNQAIVYKNAIIASESIGVSLGAVVIDKLPAQSIAASSNGKLVAIELDAEPESYVIYCNKKATKLVEEINKVLKAMIDGGVIDYYTLKHSGGIVG